MNRMKLIALAIALVAAPSVGHAQQRDTVKRDTVRKESTAEKVGRQRIYRVQPTGLHKLQAEIDRFWTNELDVLVEDAHRLRREP